jgi:hypothetical protein
MMFKIVDFAALWNADGKGIQFVTVAGFLEGLRWE